MFPLIEITTVPIEIEMKVTDAKLEYARGTADLEISRNEGGLSIKSRPIRLNMDTFEARNSIVPSPARAISQNAEKGRQAAYAATAAYTQQGKLLLTAKVGQDMIAQIAAQSQAQHVKPNVGIRFVPSVAAEMNWDPGDMQIRYEMDKLNFDWRLNHPTFEFTPGDIQISVTQRPDVEIKYVGGPLYVPPSADPNYEGDPNA